MLNKDKLGRLLRPIRGLVFFYFSISQYMIIHALTVVMTGMEVVSVVPLHPTPPRSAGTRLELDPVTGAP